MNKPPPPIGTVFNHWTVVSDKIELVKNNQGVNIPFVHCKCVCGIERNVSLSNLVQKYSRSCGCIRKTVATHHMTGTRLHNIWKGIKSRCYNPNVEYYKHYGKKGVVLCNEWLSFEAFMAWALSNKYTDELSIDRIDSEGNYEPSNCRWVTQAENSSRVVKRTRPLVRDDGVAFNCLREVAEITGLTIGVVWYYVNNETPIDGRTYRYA